MSWEARLYAAMLKLYPVAFQQHHAKPMLETYQDALNAARLEGRSLGFHLRNIAEFAPNLLSAYLESKGEPMPVLPARSMVVIVGLFLIVYLFPVLPFEKSDGLNQVRSSVFYVLLTLLLIVGFFAATRKPRSERLFFAITSVGIGLASACSVTVTWALLSAAPYATVFLSPAENPYMATWKLVVLYGLQWLPLSTLLFGGGISTILRSLEQQRLSRWFYIWLFVAGVAALRFTNQTGTWTTGLRWMAEIVTVGLLIGIAWTYWKNSSPISRTT
jgi:hypothetical protein